MGGAKEAVISLPSFLVFAFLDLLDFALCFFYRFVDSVIEENPEPCYCRKTGREKGGFAGDNGACGEISETLLVRRNIFRNTGLFSRNEGVNEEKKKVGRGFPRWSDCHCEACFSPENWEGRKQQMLYYVIKEKNPAAELQKVSENVIFLHGFLSSSSMWVKSVFPYLSKDPNIRAKLFAVDLLGFGRSPKPVNCSYTIRDQLEMIDISVIKKHSMNSFHIVAHSMGCIIAVALAAKFPDSVKSITLISPPYFSSMEDEASHNVLNRIAERKIWPPLVFGCSVMSWYEHLGRTICFIVCRHHCIWEWILKLFTWRRQLPFSVTDITKHTHQSAWHTMHNVICGGATVMDKCLETLKGKKILIRIVQGSSDQIVPLDCCHNLKARIPQAELQIISNADHASVILGRKKELTRDLEEIWSSSSQSMKH